MSKRIEMPADGSVTVAVAGWVATVDGNAVRLGCPLTGQELTQDVFFVPSPQTPTFADWLRAIGADHLGADMASFDGGVGRVLYLYDQRPAQPGRFWIDDGGQEHETDPIGDNFGYAINLDVPDFSEWGYAPFPRKGETVAQQQQRVEDGLRAFMGCFGADSFVHIDGPAMVASTREDD